MATEQATLSEAQKESLRQDIQAAAEALSMTVVPGQVLSDEAYYTHLGALDQEKQTLMLSLTNEALGIGAEEDEPKAGRADA